MSVSEIHITIDSRTIPALCIVIITDQPPFCQGLFALSGGRLDNAPNIHSQNILETQFL